MSTRRMCDICKGENAPGYYVLSFPLYSGTVDMCVECVVKHVSAEVLGIPDRERKLRDMEAQLAMVQSKGDKIK